VTRELLPDVAVGRMLGSRIRDRREALGKSQEAVANGAGISRTYYGSLENGFADRNRRDPANPTITVLLAISRELECDVCELVGGLRLETAKPKPKQRKPKQNLFTTAARSTR